MAANSIDVLRDKLYAESDARLRRLVDERLDPLRVAGNLVVNITEARAYTITELTNMIGEAYMAERRAQARNQYVDDFMRKVHQYAQTQRGR